MRVLIFPSPQRCCLDRFGYLAWSLGTSHILFSCRNLESTKVMFGNCSVYLQPDWLIIRGKKADSGPVVFNDVYFNHSSLICLKLWRCDDFVALLWIGNGVFVPHYARNLFIDHWILLGPKNCKCGFGKRNGKTAFYQFFFSLHGFSVASRVCGKWQGTCYSVAPKARGKWQETCYSVAPRVCGRWLETCYSVASRACGK